ncbi:MAG: lipopolysaccharide transport periplasmic protein LptA [Pseudomonadota bacterium]
MISYSLRIARSLLGLVFLMPYCALAEKADSTKPINVEAEQFVYDSAKLVKTISGNVVLTRGTLTMKAEKVILKEDAAGNQFVTLLAPAGGLATFRQKRDGGDFWVEGQAERIEYDSHAEIVKLFTRAKLKRFDGVRPTDEVAGALISYDSRSEFFTVNNSQAGVKTDPNERVKIVIQPPIDAKAK